MAGNRRTLNPLMQRITFLAQERNSVITRQMITALHFNEVPNLRRYRVLRNDMGSLSFSSIKIQNCQYGRAFLSTSAAKLPKHVNSDLEEEEENEHHVERYEDCAPILSCNDIGKKDGSNSVQNTYSSALSDSSDRVNTASVLIDAAKAQALNEGTAKTSPHSPSKEIKRSLENSKVTTSSKRKELLKSSAPVEDNKTPLPPSSSTNENNVNFTNPAISQPSISRQSKNVSMSNGTFGNSRSMLSVPSRSSKRCFYVPVFNPLPAMKDKTLAILDYKLWSIKDCNEFDEKVSQTETKLPPSTFVTTQARGVDLYSLDDVLDSIPSNPIHEILPLAHNTKNRKTTPTHK